MLTNAIGPGSTLHGRLPGPLSEPPVGIEPTTYSLRVQQARSTPVQPRHATCSTTTRTRLHIHGRPRPSTVAVSTAVSTGSTALVSLAEEHALSRWSPYGFEDQTVILAGLPCDLGRCRSPGGVAPTASHVYPTADGVRLVLPVLLVAADPVAVAVVSRIGAADREAAPSLALRSQPGQSNSEEAGDQRYYGREVY